MHGSGQSGHHAHDAVRHAGVFLPIEDGAVESLSKGGQNTAVGNIRLDIKLHAVYSQAVITPTWTTLEQAVERSKSEILGDVAEGIVPVTCASYSELHDYVDANGYGGAFEHDFENEETDFWNAVQDAVDAWIKNGELKSAALGAEANRNGGSR